MREKKKKKDRAALALVLCFCVVALTSVFAVKSNLDKLNTEDKNMEISKNTKTETEGTQAAAQTPVVDSKNSEKKAEKKASADYIAPLNGKIQMEYSMDMPIYSKTLDQYMTHPGIDIAAALSTKVKAIAGGTVTKVAEDDRYGMTVEITHGNGIVSIYSNLAEKGLTEEGNVVKQGDVIGIVGETALFETLEESHLHLEMTRDSAYVDPTDYIKGL
ncbi:M23 family metallopeptidase [Ihubacter massiliensis]|uniref:M23 family metallopeptidase n=1 Tax=Hominibacterium faecale TaxID=2839743 RepID=A0A9J6QVJ0_9FIRM|nr:MULTISPECIES: M23 family metallopeptidase [Eubacteriales Family XIII. Incertae Sedis]MCI7302097.1 M23 family metallopeptidase [Clostridia bacterium]MDE8731999.1 M23 family metallopeptidase [Eubacteriales bacterium DFI.9.88]MDY3010421.1 M23 family metallopeptidase [Clostridiales Family XIII bacterium]MCO7122407.1 M23 family metallopeptidase [Ihubacter massiliensis]MCU7379295.1 M23 family metallopeptidase [Hominibacterium faecale]